MKKNLIPQELAAVLIQTGRNDIKPRQKRVAFIAAALSGDYETRIVKKESFH